MNLNKFNFYKNSKFFLLGAALILLAGLIVGLVAGLNLVEAIGSSVIVDFGLILLICMSVIFVYLTIRYNSVTAFVFAFEICINSLLTVALCAIIRVPVASNFIIAIAFTIVLTAILNIIIFSKAVKHEKTNREELVNNITKENFKQILIISLTFLAVILLSLIIIDVDIFMFIRPLIVGIIITLIMTLFVSASIWGYFYKDKPKKKSITEEDKTVYFEGEDKKIKEKIDTTSPSEELKVE